MSNQSEGFAGLPQHLQPSNLPAQEPSATPSTLEIIVEREIDEILHALDTKSFERVRAESTAAILAALRRPSEGPETGRPPSDEVPSIELLVKSAYTEGFNTARETDGESAFESWLHSAAKLDLAALPAGPETGDRERLNQQEIEWVIDGLEHKQMTDKFIAKVRAVLVRQAAPAASEGQK